MVAHPRKHRGAYRPTTSDTVPGQMPEPEALGEGLSSLSDEEAEVMARVVEILRKISYGTVVIVVQDGKVVQIEVAEKFRLR